MRIPKITYKNRWWFFMATYVYVWILYLTSNHQTWFAAHELPLTYIDIHTPFLPWTGWIYITIYILPLFTGLIVNTDEDVRGLVYSFIGMTTLCTTIFLIYPTIYPRPSMTGAVSVGGALAFVRILDTAKNCFPSQHVAVAFLSAFYIRRYYKYWGTASILIAIVISISTLTTKQHYVWDILAGYLMARMTYWLSTGSWLPTEVRTGR